MPKRGTDADSRIFFDELVSIGVSRLRATGAIRLEDKHGIIAFGDKQKLTGVAHTKFPNGGSWSYFVCPKCGRRAKKLWLVDDAPRCRLCLEKLGVRYRAAYGFGRTERLRERDRRIDRLQAMLEGGPMRFKPLPPNWGNRRLDRRNRLTWALHQARIATRLALIAYQAQQTSEPDEPLPLLRAYKPRAPAIEAIPNLKSLWRAKSTEELEIALDKAQSALLQALESSDPQTRLNAASPCSGHPKQENAAGASGLNQTLGTRQAMSQRAGFRPFGDRDPMARMRKERAFVDGLANVPNATLSAHSCSVRVRKAFANCGHWLAQWQFIGIGSKASSDRISRKFLADATTVKMDKFNFSPDNSTLTLTAPSMSI